MGPPELNEDVTREILLRIPPDEPAHIFRASVVCKLWLRVVSDPAFLRRYRDFHRGAPLLGFFYDPDPSGSCPGFVPTTAASSLPQLVHSDWVRWSTWVVSDCRHGRVLLDDEMSSFAVWDSISNHLEKLVGWNSCWYWYNFDCNAVVLCAVSGCDHRSCQGGPFHVVYVGVDYSDYNIVEARVYSSQSRAWCAPTFINFDCLNCGCVFDPRQRAALVGDVIYFIVHDDGKILKYDLAEHRLSLIAMPDLYEHVPVLMQNEDGSLGIAGMLGSGLHLWSTMVNADGVTGWVKQRVIKLEEILPVDITSVDANVISFAEGVEVFFISTSVGAFTFELKSGRVKRVGEPRTYCGITPFISFFTPDRGCSKWTK